MDKIDVYRIHFIDHVMQYKEERTAFVVHKVNNMLVSICFVPETNN